MTESSELVVKYIWGNFFLKVKRQKLTRDYYNQIPYSVSNQKEKTIAQANIDKGTVYTDDFKTVGHLA